MEHLVDVYAHKLTRRVGMELDDARQELRIVVWMATQAYDETRGKLDHYLSATLKNETNRIIRYETRRYFAEAQYEAECTRTHEDSPEDRIVNAVFLAELGRVLSDKEREILLWVMSGDSQTEVGSRLGISRSLVAQMWSGICRKSHNFLALN